MQAIPLPAPYGGVNEQLPKIAVESPQCLNMVNFNVNQAGVSLRKGDKYIATLAASYAGVPRFYPQVLVNFKDSKLLALVCDTFGGVLYLSDAYTTTLIGGIATFTANYPHYQTLFFNGYQFFFGYNGVTSYVYYYDGTVYAAAGYTGSSGTFLPYGGNVYKTRAYFKDAIRSGYYYTGISAISGVCQFVDLSGVITQESNIAIIAKITLSDTLQSEQIQCFVFYSGEVLFYSGSYPDSSDWTLVGRSSIANPYGLDSGVAYQNDYIVFTSSGPVSLRNLFLKGSEEATSLSIFNNVRETWAKIYNFLSSAFSQSAKGIYDSNSDRIVITVPSSSVDPTGAISQRGITYFIYYTPTQSWYYHKTTLNYVSDLVRSGTTIAFFKNQVYFLADLGLTNGLYLFQKEGNTGYLDDLSNSINVEFQYNITSAPIPVGRSNVFKASGLDVILQTDLQSVTNFQFQSDLGVSTSVAQKSSNLQTTLQKTYISMGITGSYIQYLITGTTTSGKTVGLDIYGLNVWGETGQNPR